VKALKYIYGQNEESRPGNGKLFLITYGREEKVAKIRKRKKKRRRRKLSFMPFIHSVECVPEFFIEVSGYQYGFTAREVHYKMLNVSEASVKSRGMKKSKGVSRARRCAVGLSLIIWRRRRHREK
jgi:hypothetical protein